MKENIILSKQEIKYLVKSFCHPLVKEKLYNFIDFLYENYDVKTYLKDNKLNSKFIDLNFVIIYNRIKTIINLNIENSPISSKWFVYRYDLDSQKEIGIQSGSIDEFEIFKQNLESKNKMVKNNRYEINTEIIANIRERIDHLYHPIAIEMVNNFFSIIYNIDNLGYSMEYSKIKSNEIAAQFKFQIKLDTSIYISFNLDPNVVKSTCNIKVNDKEFYCGKLKDINDFKYNIFSIIKNHQQSHFLLEDIRLKNKFETHVHELYRPIAKMFFDKIEYILTTLKKARSDIPVSLIIVNDYNKSILIKFEKEISTFNKQYLEIFISHDIIQSNILFNNGHYNSDRYFLDKLDEKEFSNILIKDKLFMV